MTDFGEAVAVGEDASGPDRQWLDEAIEVPAIPLTAQLRDRLSPDGLSVAYTVGRRCLNMLDDCKPTMQIPEGASLPIWEDTEYDGILKVIRDFRTLQGRLEPLVSRGFAEDEEAFNQQTRLMRKDGIYTGGPAKLKVTFDDDERPTTLTRTVAYYCSAPSKQQLAGIPSGDISTCEVMPLFTTTFLPPLRVGTAYKHGDRGVSRVTFAEVLRSAHGNAMRPARGSRRNISLMPRLALDPLS